MLDWESIFKEAVSQKEYSKRKLEKLIQERNSLEKEWAIYAVFDYIAHFSPSSEEIEFLKENIIECEEFYQRQAELRNCHFGYPANLFSHSKIYELISNIESRGYLANNCGDTYEQGYYQMDSKKIEQSILAIFAKKLGIRHNFWGYITSGGSESNAWGIENGFRYYPEGILYFCEAAHYSVYKDAQYHKNIVISQKAPNNESIDVKQLIEKIQYNNAPAIIILTWGTTKYGSCDDIADIVAQLREKSLPFYIHVDAALYGGIPNNQKNAPIIENVEKLGIHSISISLHKYIGMPSVRSILLAFEKPLCNSVEYIGQTDTTTSGSRCILPFTTRQQLYDILMFSKENEYSDKVSFFESLLKEHNIPFDRSSKGNIFVIDKPSENLCNKYQLSTFSINIDGHTVDKAHVIIFPYHSYESMKMFIVDISEEM